MPQAAAPLLPADTASRPLRLLRYDLSGSNALDKPLRVKIQQVTSGSRISVRSVADGVAASHNGDSVLRWLAEARKQMRKSIPFIALGLGLVLTTFWIVAIAWLPLQFLGAALSKVL